jgi:hypothetical protein
VRTNRPSRTGVKALVIVWIEALVIVGIETLIASIIESLIGVGVDWRRRLVLIEERLIRRVRIAHLWILLSY